MITGNPNPNEGTSKRDPKRNVLPRMQKQRNLPRHEGVHNGQGPNIDFRVLSGLRKVGTHQGKRFFRRALFEFRESMKSVFVARDGAHTKDGFRGKANDTALA